jgi:hypothetical protein
VRRLLLGLLVLVLWGGACADDVDTETGAPSTSSPSSTTSAMAPSSTVVTSTVPTTTAEPVRWPVDVGTTALPALVVADGMSIDLYRSRDGVVLERMSVATADHPVTHVHRGSDGDAFVREIEPLGDGESVEHFVRYDFDAGREELDVEWIFDVAVIDGIEAVIVAVPSPDGYGFGGLEAWAVDDGRVVADLGLAAEAEFGVTDFDWSEAAGFGVASAWSDLTEWVGFVDASGSSVDLPSPTDDLAYNAPPYVTAAAIDDEGGTLYWVEGPDWGFDPETNESGPIAAPWELHGADLATGETTLVWPLSESVLDSTVLSIHSIVPAGDFVIINRTTLRGTESVSLAPLVLDLSGEEPELYEYPVIGIATAAAS